MSKVTAVVSNSVGVPEKLFLQQEFLYRQASMITPKEQETDDKNNVFDDYVAVLRKGGVKL